jgi:phosphatidyl-myo-inositol dimannoside synthase
VWALRYPADCSHSRRTLARTDQGRDRALVADIGRPSLAVITRKQGGDGVAFAGLLLERALSQITRAPLDTLELAPAVSGRPSSFEQARFTLSLVLTQLLERRGWWMFNHVGIARAQSLVPQSVRRPYAVLLCGIESWDPALSDDRKRTLRNATLRLAISEYTASRVSTTHPEIGPIIACPLALLPDAPSPTSLEHAMLDQIRESSVLIVGRMSSAERYKGHDELLECWSTVVAQVPDAQLVMAGQGDDVTRLRGKAASLSIDSSVLFLGFVPDGTLATLRERVALFALPSRGEGFGLVYLEAMRAGLPCVGGIHDAAADVISNGETGVLVNPKDGRALSSAIVTLLRSPDLRVRFGAAGKLRFEREFTFDRYCERLAPILSAAFT